MPQRPVAQQAAGGVGSSGSGAAPFSGKKLVGLGSVGVDYLASVAAFPAPDAKIRTEKLEARLGVRTAVFTKLGGDALADGIVAELTAEGVDVSQVRRGPPGSASPFTYIIVDVAGATRTCIHTPGPDLIDGELTPEAAASLLSGADLAYFDGRLTSAALTLAAAARAAGVPVLVEAERLRPGLDALLEMADYVVTSAGFPQAWTGAATREEGMVEVLAALPRVRWVATTIGAQGAILLERMPPAQSATGAAAQQPQQLAALVADLRARCQPPPAGADALTLAAAAGGALPRRGASSPPVTLARAGTVSASARAASAAAEAAANGHRGRGSEYGAAMAPSVDAVGAGGGSTAVRVHYAPAAVVDAVQDTTGAGDAFIGAACVALMGGMAPEALLPLASWVAGMSVRRLGPRPGLPRWTQVPRELWGQQWPRRGAEI